MQGMMAGRVASLTLAYWGGWGQLVSLRARLATFRPLLHTGTIVALPVVEKETLP
jgi:hypothetical protein